MNKMWLLGAFAAGALSVQGCGGSGTDSSGGGGAGGSTGGSTGGSGGTMSTGGTTSMGGTMNTGGTTGGTGGSTGGSASSDQGAPGNAFVNAGGTAKSANYKMVFTLGQSTQNQGRTKSASYALQGGLIGATGSFK